MDNVQLYSKLANLPENLKDEVSNFIDILLANSKNKGNHESKPKPKYGSSKGMFVIKPNFDEPLEDFNHFS